MNKAKVQQILQLETKAQEIKTNALTRAKQIVMEAKADAEKQKEESALAAEQEIRKIHEKAISEANVVFIQERSEREESDKEKLAKKNFGKAVDFVLAQLTVQE